MKVSEKNQPILKALRSKKPLDYLKIHSSFKDSDLTLFQMIIDDFPLSYYSDNFIKAYNSSSESFLKTDLLRTLKKGDGDFILTKEKVTVGFVIGENKDNVIKVLSQCFLMDTLQISGVWFFDTNGDELGVDFVGTHPDSMIKEDLIKVIGLEMLSFMGLQLFKKYAPIEEKLIKKGTKCKLGLVKKAINDSKSDINYIDCSWFTKIVRSKGFKVRGHFRLQPYKNKEGQWTKKLIYINEFEKNGYTRDAKKENNI